MKRAKKLPRRAVMLAICRGRVIRSAEAFAECLGVPVDELLRIAGVNHGA
jgi:hypothetical protein